MTHESSHYQKTLVQQSGLKFADMTPKQKLVFTAKLVACIATFGYAFPNVQHD